MDYPSEDITAIIGFSPGGSYDVYTRQYAEMLPDYFPNPVNVVPTNRPGAGSRVGLTEIYRADPDGYTIGSFLSPGVGIYQALIGTEEFDVNELSYICDISQHPYSIAVAEDGPYDTFDDLLEADQIVFSATSVTSPTVINTALVANQLEIEDKVEYITGHPGATETRVAVVRGDVDAVMTTIPAALSFFEDDDLKPVIQFTGEEYFLLEDIEPGTPLSENWGLDNFNDIFAINYPFVAPPDTPQEVMSVLETAFREASESEEMQEWAVEAGRPITYLDGEAAHNIVTQGVETFSEFEDVLVPKMEELEG